MEKQNLKQNLQHKIVNKAPSIAREIYYNTKGHS